ncbi:MAG: PLP-dependent aminotransferase family protein [Candidatus Rokubacteria bacterium]|nr:PLP-dependent aminotransferase family protein [Candidatus Rokubacteria bacterium]
MLVTLREDRTLSTQVYASLRRAILAGELAAGTRLPSTRTLARDLAVSRNTVLLAYDQLLAEGYVEGRPGSGTYVAQALPEAPAGAARATARVQTTPARLSAYGARAAAIRFASPRGPDRHLPYDFRYGTPKVAEFPHAVWRRLLGRHARGSTVATMAYGPPEGAPVLREAIAAYLRRARAVVCDPAQVLVVNGSQQALDLTARVLIDAGDTVALEEPNYLGARWAFHAAGARLVAAPVDADGLDVTRLGRERARARLVYATPSHQFPTGVVMSLSRRLALLEWASANRAWVVEDDYDSEYRYEGRPIEAVQGLDRSGRVIYVGTASKVLFPALRLGYLVVPPSLVEAFTAAKWVTDRHSATLEQLVLADFIADGHFERHLRRSRTRNAARREALLAALHGELGDRVDVVGANAGVHLLAWLRGLSPAAVPALIEDARGEGVGVYSIAPYYFRSPPQAGLMLGYAALDERTIREGIRRLARVYDKHR